MMSQGRFDSMMLSWIRSAVERGKKDKVMMHDD